MSSVRVKADDVWVISNVAGIEGAGVPEAGWYDESSVPRQVPANNGVLVNFRTSVRRQTWC